MIKKNEEFICNHCGKHVKSAIKGKCRNHCNYCLHSMHVDIEPGDRKHTCKGLMKPIRIEERKNGLYLQHECIRCGIKKWNKILEDDRIANLGDII